MSFERDLRIAVLGATGSLGCELLRVLEKERLPVSELLPYASERSLGESVEFKGQEFPARTESPELSGVDLLFLCAPPAPSLEFTREALKNAVLTIDLSGALATQPEVPLLCSSLPLSAEQIVAPLIATPSSASLLWVPVLQACLGLGLSRVVGTVLESVGGSGRDGLDALSGETVAIFSQREVPEPVTFGQQIAFDCLPAVGALDADGVSSCELRLQRELQRILGSSLRVGVHSALIPAFSGQAASLALELDPGVTLAQLREALDEAPGVVLWEESAAGPTFRDALGEDGVLVGRLREDPSREGGFLLWAVGDPLRLSALNAVELAFERFAGAGSCRPSA